MKITAKAPANIAFIKYWGKKNDASRLPENGSVSMNLSNMNATCTVEFQDVPEDAVTINNERNEKIRQRISAHLDRIRTRANVRTKAKVVIQNNFPIATGLSSSASIFASVTVAGAKAAGLTLSEKELSILARQGSGSACRSIPDGFVEWLEGESNDTSYAVSLHPPSYWDIVDIVAVVSTDKKDVPTSEGQKLVRSSPFFEIRKTHIGEKLALCKKFLTEKNFPAFGEYIEAEALEMHAIMLTSQPPLIYWTPPTLRIMKQVKQWRHEGLPVYFTINTGQDIHLLSVAKDAQRLVAKLKAIEEVRSTIVNKPSIGARIINDHLF
jgi:diphosphomevalonate decarboxylase